MPEFQSKAYDPYSRAPERTGMTEDWKFIVIQVGRYQPKEAFKVAQAALLEAGMPDHATKFIMKNKAGHPKWAPGCRERSTPEEQVMVVRAFRLGYQASGEVPVICPAEVLDKPVPYMSKCSGCELGCFMEGDDVSPPPHLRNSQVPE